MLLSYLCMILCFQMAIARSNYKEFSARELDSQLQNYAFRAFFRPETGVFYKGKVPSKFSGVEVAALRLRSGSLRRRGVSRYKEFHIPVGLVEQPYVERVVLVYHKLSANWSSLYYPLPGYTFLTPVLGLLAYDATNLSAKNLSELDIRASGNPVSIKFSHVKFGPKRPLPMCVYFGLDGSVRFDNVVKKNTCLTTNQGHFSIVVESSIAPAPAPSGCGGGDGGGGGGGGGKWWSKKVWIIVGCGVGGLVILVLILAVFFVCVKKCRRRKKIERMEEVAEWEAPLPMTSVGRTKAPVAMGTRTRPLLENEFVP